MEWTKPLSRLHPDIKLIGLFCTEFRSEITGAENVPLRVGTHLPVAATAGRRRCTAAEERATSALRW